MARLGELDDSSARTRCLLACIWSFPRGRLDVTIKLELSFVRDRANRVPIEVDSIVTLLAPRLGKIGNSKTFHSTDFAGSPRARHQLQYGGSIGITIGAVKRPTFLVVGPQAQRTSRRDQW